MTERRPDDDVVERIAAAFDRDLPPIPAALSAAARDAFQWRNADAALAVLTFDSATDELAGVRGSASDRRSFRFTSDDGVVRVHLTSATMIVMIEPPLEVSCRVVSGTGAEASVVEDRTDEFGEVAIDAPEFPIRVEVELPGGTVVTPWITS